MYFSTELVTNEDDVSRGSVQNDAGWQVWHCCLEAVLRHGASLDELEQMAGMYTPAPALAPFHTVKLRFFLAHSSTWRFP